MKEQNERTNLRALFLDSSPVGNPSTPVSEEVVNYSTRRVTRSQQQGVTVSPKKYPLRQSRSSGSDTEQHGEISERGRRRKPHGSSLMPSLIWVSPCLALLTCASLHLLFFIFISDKSEFIQHVNFTQHEFSHRFSLKIQKLGVS